MAQLMYSAGGKLGRRFPVRGKSAVLGRQQDCEIVLPLPVVSRRHARIVREGADYYIEDLGSTNGTYVNGELVSQRRLLCDGDRIGIDRIVLNFCRDTDGGSNLVEGSDDESELATARGEPNVRVSLAVDAVQQRFDVNSEAKLRAVTQTICQFNAVDAVDTVDAIFERLIDASAEAFPQADRIYLLTLDEESRLQLRAYRLREKGGEEMTMPLINRSMARQAMAEGKALLIDDAAVAEGFGDSGSVLDGHVRSVICAPLKPSTGETIGVIHLDTNNAASQFTQDDLDVLASMACVAADRLKLGRLHESEVQSQRLAGVAQAMAVISHKTRNSLQVFKLGLEQLQDQLGSEGALSETIASMFGAELQLEQLLDNMQLFAGRLTLERESLELRSIWQQAWVSLASELEDRDAALEDGAPEFDTRVQGDSRYLQEVFRNLLENSLSACSDPVRITITCEATQCNDLPALSVSVRDNGPGLNAEQRQKVFDPFYSTAPHRVGLGMAIVRRILIEHEGQITVGGGPGAEFRISLPRKPSQ